MHRIARSAMPTLCLSVFLVAHAAAQPGARRTDRHAPAQVSADSLRASLFAIADDSMGGRQTGTIGNAKAADWVAASFARYGLQPAGEGGTFFQTLPFWRIAPDTASGLEVNGTRLGVGRDIVPVGIPLTWVPNGAVTIHAGAPNDSTTWPPAGQAAGKIVVLKPPPDADPRAALGAFGLRRNPRFSGAAAFAVAILDALPPGVVDQLMQGRMTTDTTVAASGVSVLLVTTSAASALLSTPLASAAPGLTGPAVTGRVSYSRGPLLYPVRNVVALLPGSDPALRATYVSLTAHNDHMGVAARPVDHDSTRAFNRVVRPMGADSPMRPPTPAEATRIQSLRDSLRAAHPPKADSIYNGADDDGSGTVMLVELARVLSQGPRARRSILFVSHAAEERGLLGSRWFTDHPTRSRDSIVAEMDMDMVGRGGAADLPKGGPGYVELVGSRRLSTEFGNLIDSLGAREPVPFRFNYEYDAPGHPLQYYCRADHFSYARYGIASASISTGEHLDYHQVTDEPQYIDYQQLALVTSLVRDIALAVANLDHRPVVDGPRGDPHGPCRQ